jgi:uncharacterized protein (UPF0128 family)
MILQDRIALKCYAHISNQFAIHCNSKDKNWKWSKFPDKMKKYCVERVSSILKDLPENDRLAAVFYTGTCAESIAVELVELAGFVKIK